MVSTLTKTPVLIINLKTYAEGTGKDSLRIAKAAKRAARIKGYNVFLAVQATDIRLIARKVKIPLLAQHVDPKTYGSHTGSVIPEAIKEAGAVGTLINHSEKRLPEKTIRETIDACKKNGLITVLCTKDAEESKKYAKYYPDFIAVEPPKLIGGDVSVSDANPGLIKKTVANTKNIPVLCGAGVKNRNDVLVAVRLGAKGILVASGVDKAKNVYKEILNLLDGFH